MRQLFQRAKMNAKNATPQKDQETNYMGKKIQLIVNCFMQQFHKKSFPDLRIVCFTDDLGDTMKDFDKWIRKIDLIIPLDRYNKWEQPRWPVCNVILWPVHGKRGKVDTELNYWQRNFQLRDCMGHEDWVSFAVNAFIHKDFEEEDEEVARCPLSDDEDMALLANVTQLWLEKDKRFEEQGERA
jgi:hypothetical protein